MWAGTRTTAALLCATLLVDICSGASISPKTVRDTQPVCAADGTCTDPAATRKDPWGFLKGLEEEEALVEWIQSLEGGFVATDLIYGKKTNIGSEEDEDELPEDLLNPDYDFVASQDIEKGTVLMEIPQEAMLGGILTDTQSAALKKFMDSPTIEEELKIHIPMCMAIEAITNEAQKGPNSKYHPYLDFVFGAGNPEGKTPNDWSEMGQFLFFGMVGPENTLYAPAKEHFNIYHEQVCKEYLKLSERSQSPLEAGPDFDEDAWEDHQRWMEGRAHAYFTKHAWGTNFIPVFDMISHGNGHLKNVEAKYVDVETNEVIPIEPRKKRFEGFMRRDGSSAPKKIKLVVYAHRDIREGELLRVSYNQCEHLGCENLSIEYTAGDIFGHLGIIEEYPRRWTFKVDPHETEKSDYYFVFDIHLDPETQEKTFHLVQNTHPEEEIYKLSFLGRSVTRWRSLKAELDGHMGEGTDWYNDLVSVRDEYEHEYISKFYYAFMEACEIAWKHRYDKEVQVNSTTAVIEAAVTEIGTTQDVMEGYDDLSGPKGPTVTTRGTHLACAEGEYVDEGKLVGIVKGFYQTLEYFYEPGIENTYIRMSTWLHSGSNFRAHYHEGVIHVALQYVKEPKRVAYIGGGDNMVLAEVLKYPGIEKVVGMELDQQACRSSMRYFGTSPNYHDDRVEWWYGNGALALQLLPEEYFGSFDLVLVDLLNDVSEAIRVTADLSLADVAPLLVNPNGGVLARNEDQVDRSEVTTRLGNRVVMYDYYDCPRLCEVSISIASNSVDFAKGPRYDHNISTVMRLKNFTNDAYDGWTRYYDSTTDASNTPNPTICKKMQRALSEEQQPSSSGVFMIIEAENVTESLEVDDLPRLHEKIENIAKDYGLSPMASAHEPKSNVHSFVLLCEQGYIKMQTHPQFQYVGFDLSLWGGITVIDKTEEIQRALVAAVGGGILEGSVSTYRISTGGMGAKEEDNVDNGLVKKALEYYCGSDNGSSKSDSDGEKSANDDEKTLNEEDQIMNDSSILHDILMDVIAKKENQQSAFVVFCGKEADEDCGRYASASFHPIYSCESIVDMQGCELEITQNLQDIVSEHKLLDGFVLDRSVSLEMGKVLHKVFNNTLHQANFLEDSFAALAPGSEASWRNILLDRFRTEIIIADNVEKADFEIMNGSLSELWSVVSIQNKNFYGVLQDSLAALEEKTGFSTVTRKILDSMIPLITDWQPHNPKDFDFFNQDVMDQWFSQRPVANQYILQMQVDSQPDPPEVGETVLIGSKFIKDGVYGGEGGFLFEHMEGTIVEVNGRNRFVAETKPFIAKNGAIKQFQHLFANNATKEIPRRQIRRISKTETDRIFYVGDLVLANQVHNETGERMPNAWYAAMVMGISEEGVSVRPRDYKDSDHPFQQILPREDVWVWSESPEFHTRNAGVSLKALQEAFEKSIGKAGLAPKDSYANLGTIEVGKGYIMSFVSSKGSGVMKWDGADRVEVNILVTDGDFREDFDSEIRRFSVNFLGLLPSLNLIGKDSFPRGYGKVVNFQHEMDWAEGRRRAENIDYHPHWMNGRLPEWQKLETPAYHYVGNDFVDFSGGRPTKVEEEEDDDDDEEDDDEDEEE